MGNSFLCIYNSPSKWGFCLCVVLPHLYIFSYKKQTVIEHGLQRKLLQCRMDSPPDVLFYLLLLICGRLYPTLYNWQSVAKGPTQIAITHLEMGLILFTRFFGKYMGPAYSSVWACLANGSEHRQGTYMRDVESHLNYLFPFFPSPSLPFIYFFRIFENLLQDYP